MSNNYDTIMNFLYDDIFQYSSDTSIKIAYEPGLTFLFQIEHTVDDGPHVLHFEKNHETALAVRFTLYATGSVAGS